MALSSKIISKFAKTVTKKETKKEETILYGKISRYDEENDTWYVQLDGAPNDTPVANFASSIDKDQRVIVMIKNHSAVVTGNIGSPATSQKYVDEKIYPTIGSEASTNIGGLVVQNYYSIEFDENGKPIYKIIDNTSAEGTKEIIYEIPISGTSGECESVDLADIRALWPDCDYE